MDLETYAVPEAMVEAVAEHLAIRLRQLCRKAVIGDEARDEAVDLAAVGPGPDLRGPERERFLAQVVPLADLARRVPDDECPGDVGVARRLEVDREEIEDEHVVAPDRSGPHVVPDGGLRPVGDDHLLGERAVREERRLDALLEELAGDGLSFDGETTVRGLRSGEDLSRGCDPCLCSSLRAPYPFELVRALHPATVVEEALVDDELDAALAEHVGDPDREVPRHARATDAETLHDASRQLPLRLVDVDSAAPNLVRSELLGRPNVEPGSELLHSHRLHGAADDDPPAVEFRVHERVRNSERNLVPELGHPDRVADQQDVPGHRTPILTAS